jgi:hypothetical protein
LFIFRFSPGFFEYLFSGLRLHPVWVRVERLCASLGNEQVELCELTQQPSADF